MIGRASISHAKKHSMTAKSLLFRAAAAVASAGLTASGFAWTINARELVDVQFSADDSLLILVSSPNALSPAGVYVWKHDADAPQLLCRINSATSFSFDRKTIIERVSAAAPQLRLYEPSTCRLLDRIQIDGVVMDADVHGKLIAVAVRLPDTTSELRVYGKPAKRAKHDRVLARAVIGRNVEMGFAPDGRSVVNFDLSDTAASAWRAATLAAVSLPTWTTEGETTFVPGSTFVKRYVADTLSVARWPSGTVVYRMTTARSVPSVRSVRLRQLSGTGRYGALHSFDATNASATTGQSLEWIDFATQKRVRLATGSIDNAAINVAGNRVAWVLRGSELGDSVSVQFAQINADGNVVEKNAAK